jgi:hypothetical protein
LSDFSFIFISLQLFGKRSWQSIPQQCTVKKNQNTCFYSMPWSMYAYGSRQTVWPLVVCLSSLLGFVLGTDETQPLPEHATSVFDLTMPVEEPMDDEEEIPPTQPDEENNDGAGSASDPPRQVLASHDQLW